MKTPDDFRMKILKNPWFLWVLVILGVNPLEYVAPVSREAAMHLLDVPGQLKN